MSSKVGRLKRTWGRVRNEPGLGRNVAILAVLLVLAGVTGGIVLSNQRFNPPWENKFHFYATFEGAPGVSPGNGQEVRIAGVPVGDIRTASLDNTGKAKLELAIDPKYKVYDNARLILRPKSPLNEMYVEMNPGGPPGNAIPSEGTLPVTDSQRPVQVDEVLDHLDDNSRDALTTLLSESDVALANAPQNLPAGVGATDQVTKDLKPVVSALETRRETLQKLVTNLAQISNAVGGDDRRLGDLTTSLHQTLAVLGKQSGPMDSTLAQLPGLTNQLRSATDAVQSLSGQLDPTLDNLRQASGTLPESLTRVTRTVDQLGSTVDAARPVVDKAGPVVEDLRPFVSDLNAALPDLKASTVHLDPMTATAVRYAPDLGAFILNNRSITTMRDANAGLLRGMLEITPGSLPDTSQPAPAPALAPAPR